MRTLQSFLPRLLVILAVVALCAGSLKAQQTLGGITGEVTDASGGVIPNVTVTATDEQTALTRTVKSNETGSYSFVNLPIGSYTLTYAADGYEVQKTPHITVQADRTATVNAALKVGKASTTVEVEAAPLMNAVDTTNGYVMETSQISATPLPTGSFTGLAIQSPGVNAELPGGTGANSGMGNAPIWANGQRDTSNAFLLNGVDGSNLFNGKTTSQVDSFRVVNNTGQANNAAGGVVPSAASVYLAIGNAIPTPAPEVLEEVRVNASMYDAQQGSSSGAHIDMSTKGGTNDMHGAAYFHRGTNWINAAPFFFKKDDNIPASDKNPQLHRYTLGGDLGGPIIRNKLFGFVAYQHMHVSDQETGDELLDVPPGLSDTNRQTYGSLGALADSDWIANESYSGITSQTNASSYNPIAIALFNAKVPGPHGTSQWLVPDQNATGTPNVFSPYNAFLQGTSYFIADQAVADLDWNASPRDTVSAKYFYQHDPSSSPYAYSNVPGFTEHMDTGSQVASLNNVQTIGTSLSISETVGVLREKVYSTNDQPFGPSDIGMSSAFGNYFPGVTINDAIGDKYDSSTGPLYGLTAPSLSIGPGAMYQGANTGMFQNRIMPSATAIWSKGKHSLSFGGSWSYTQLDVRDRRTGTGMVATPDFVTFLNNWVTPYSTQNFSATTFLQGNANRYYRANETGLFIQDKFQLKTNLSITAGLRYDWDGGLTEKNGNIFNFDPSTGNPDSCSTNSKDPNQFSYCPSATPYGDSWKQTGFIIAGNSANGTKGVSNTTLTGRQWGIAPRLGLAWQPSAFHQKIVVRAGSGFYYDRGELYTYLSPGYAAGEIDGGPFGVVQTPPFVSQQHCPYSESFNAADPTYLYLNYIPICGGDDFTPPPSNGTYTLATPWGASLGAPPSNPKASDINGYLPDAADLIDGTVQNNNAGQPFTLGVYNRKNKLPYSINFTFNIQYQPRNDMMIEIGYVGNLGRHEVVPVPFNQAQIATTSSPTHNTIPNLATQSYSYGYTVYNPNLPPFGSPICVNLDPNCTYGTMLNNYEGGNIDLRVPYIGYSSESLSYTAAGISAYHALEAHFEKKLSHGFQAAASYTFSHSTDEQSGLGLFYNGNNPDNLRGGYGSSDFDRTHVIDITYGYTTPKFFNDSTLLGKAVNGWALHGVAVVQSGQPYSVIDYSGAVGSIYYSTFDGIINPIVPLASGCTRKNALTGQNGAFYNLNTGTGAALKASCFTLPLIAQGSMGVPQGDPYETNFTAGERNIFRQSWQKRTDASLVKEIPLHDKYTLRYTLDVYNVTNTASFDIPQNNVNQNQAFNNVPDQIGMGFGGTPTQAGPTNDCQSNPYGTNTGFYNCPSGLGITKHTIGAPRQIQMSLHLDF